MENEVIIFRGEVIQLLRMLKYDLLQMPYHILINVVASSFLIPRPIRKVIYRLVGINVKTNNVYPDCYIGTKKLSLGSNVLISRGCLFYNGASIVIEDHCDVGMNVMFCTASHEIGDSSKRAGNLTTSPITVKKGSWIGANSTILPGVTIEEGCIIAAGSVVNKHCEKNGLYAGVPAKRIKDLD